MRKTFLVFILVLPWIYVLSLAPFPLLHGLAQLLSFLLNTVFNYRRSLVQQNIAKAFPNLTPKQLKEITKKFYLHFADLFIEIIKAVTLSKRDFKKRYTVSGFDHIEEILNRKRSVIIMAGHQSNWEWTSALSLYTTHRFYAIYQKINNRYFDAFMRKNRARTGLYLLPTYLTKKTIAEHHKNQEVSLYGFLSDQSPTLKKTKLWTDFFGRYVPVHTGAEELAREFDLAVFYMDLKKVKRSHYHADFSLLAEHPATLEPYVLTKMFLSKVETSVKEQPETYLWTHRRFKHEKAKENS